jgi:hypothetical protein
MRPRFVPIEKSYDELYSEDRTIDRGPEFERMFGSNSAEVIVDGVEPAGYLRFSFDLQMFDDFVSDHLLKVTIVLQL